MCAKAFATAPVPGVVTFVSRGTDDDAHGVLAGFGLTGDIVRTPGDDGFDIVDVTLREADLERIPESRIHTALEASLNCEVRIRTGVAASGSQELQDRRCGLHPGVKHVEVLHFALRASLRGALPGILRPGRVDQL